MRMGGQTCDKYLMTLLLNEFSFRFVHVQRSQGIQPLWNFVKGSVHAILFNEEEWNGVSLCFN